MKKFFDASYNYVASLKPKPTARRKLDLSVDAKNYMPDAHY
jgi:hypothetical protein